jgi:hypothetical protein
MMKGLVLGLLACLLWSVPAPAQLPVTDAVVTTTTANMLLALKGILDDARTQLEELANWGAVMQQLQIMAQLVTDIEALAVEVNTLSDGWDTLSDSGRVLCSIDEAVAWKGQALGWQQQAFRLARIGQRLMGRTVAVLVDVQLAIRSIVGSTSGGQSTSALLAVITAQMEQLQGMTATFHSATMGHDLIESIVGIQLICIQQSAFADWGSYSR